MFIAYIPPLAPPSSVSISGSSRIVYTNKLKLTCSTSGTVDYYRWYRNSSILNTTTRHFMKSPAQLSDSGSYQCEACNRAGCTSNRNYTVTVIGWSTWMVYHVINSTVKPLPVYQCMLCVHGTFSCMVQDF